MRNAILSVALCGFLAGPMAQVAEAQASRFTDFEAVGITGELIGLERYLGSVLLVVNTASKCGFTYQFEGLQALWERYSADGLVVLGFPSDDFAGQEFDTDAETLAFCTGEYNVDFPMFSQIDVTGADIHPAFDFLTRPDSAGVLAGPVTWNFNKFVIDRDGRLAARFDTASEPESDALVAAIEALLAE